MSTEFVTPVGRLVQGDVTVPQTTDASGVPLTIKTGPNAGQATQRFFVAVAIPKTDPGWPEFYARLQTEARSGYPQLFNPQGQCTNPRFAWKIADGDGVDANGAPNNAKEGFAGHWVVKFVTQYAPKLIDVGGQYINDPTAIKRGYYVRVFGNCAPNIGSNVPGLYLNHTGIQLCGYGPEIVGGPDIAAAFAAAGPVRLPPGASAMPVAPVAMPAMGGAGGPPPMMAPPPVHQPAAAAPSGPPPMMAPPQPNHAFVANAMAGAPGAGGPPPMMAPPPVQPQFIMTPKAQGWSREEWHRSGYTDEALIQQGFMIQG